MGQQNENTPKKPNDQVPSLGELAKTRIGAKTISSNARALMRLRNDDPAKYNIINSEACTMLMRKGLFSLEDILKTTSNIPPFAFFNATQFIKRAFYVLKDYNISYTSHPLPSSCNITTEEGIQELNKRIFIDTLSSPKIDDTPAKMTKEKAEKLVGYIENFRPHLSHTSSNITFFLDPYVFPVIMQHKKDLSSGGYDNLNNIIALYRYSVSPKQLYEATINDPEKFNLLASMMTSQVLLRGYISGAKALEMTNQELLSLVNVLNAAYEVGIPINMVGKEIFNNYNQDNIEEINKHILIKGLTFGLERMPPIKTPEEAKEFVSKLSPNQIELLVSPEGLQKSSWPTGKITPEEYLVRAEAKMKQEEANIATPKKDQHLASSQPNEKSTHTAEKDPTQKAVDPKRQTEEMPKQHKKKSPIAVQKIAGQRRWTKTIAESKNKPTDKSR